MKLTLSNIFIILIIIIVIYLMMSKKESYEGKCPADGNHSRCKDAYGNEYCHNSSTCPSAIPNTTTCPPGTVICTNKKYKTRCRKTSETCPEN